MIYRLETFDKKVFELSESQYQSICGKIDTSKFLNINGIIIATSSVKDLYADYETTKQRHEEKNNDVNKLLGGSVIGYLTSGESPKVSKEMRLKLKKIWFEHVKRRPEIDKKMSPLRVKRWQEWKTRVGISAIDPMAKKPPFLEHPPYSTEELRIIETPVEELMEKYEKSLT